MVKLRGMGWVGKDEKDQTEFFLLDFSVYYKEANRRKSLFRKGGRGGPGTAPSQSVSRIHTHRKVLGSFT